MRRAAKTIVAISGLSLFAAPVVAQAQTGRHYRPRAQYDEPYVRVAPAQVCQRMCPQDFSPCDPLYFKLADGRCANIHTGR